MRDLDALMRGHDLELERDADTGGQPLCVIELAKALGRHPRVDDPAVSPDYAAPAGGHPRPLRRRLPRRCAAVAAARYPAGDSTGRRYVPLCAAPTRADFLLQCADDPAQWQRISDTILSRVAARYTGKLYAERMMTLSRSYGFRKSVSKLEHGEAGRCLQRFRHLQFRPLARAVGEH